MRKSTARLALTLAALLAVPTLSRAQSAANDTCLMFAARNISNPGANFYLYYTFSTQKIPLQKGDQLSYDLYAAKSNPSPAAGLDIDTDRGNLRDSNTNDTDNRSAHPNTALPQGKWVHRTIPLDKLDGQSTKKFNLVAEGDARGGYVYFVDNVLITNPSDPTRKFVIYDNGQPAARAMAQKEGYSQTVLLKPVDRAAITDDLDPATFVDAELKHFALQSRIDALRGELDISRKIADRTNDPHLKQHLAETTKLIDDAEKDPNLDADALQSLIHTVHQNLDHRHPEMEKYTGHLVGHAHIDFQWLWEWPETIQVCHDTFGQALKFMKEFPGFTFSQSSTALYAVTEEKHPEIFKGIQEEVAKGHWELVGGRVCEGDEHMISPESHARHFLYGQRYFREHFNGKSAIVGWEPDTFGHTAQFPQILQLGGCKYFYFCRGGYNLPLFWWAAPDGTKVLAFEEPATGGWYNGDVQINRFDRLFNFADKTGVKDMLWVYGVGNHGGGPTRENITAALNFQSTKALPNVKFSTATEFFHDLEKYDLTKIPTHTGDMNLGANTVDDQGLYGTYTTHSDIKRWNRDAESITESAEAVAALAATYGFAYPTKKFRRNWEDICWNHHHDTLTGTSIHPSYNLSEQMYKRVIESSAKIAGSALGYLGTQVKLDSANVLVFNPTGWTGSGIVHCLGANPEDTYMTSSTDSAGIQKTARGPVFYATDIPPYGYKTYRFSREIRQTLKAEGPTASADGTTLENPEYKLTFDPKHGVVTSIYDKRNNRESVSKDGSANRLEVHWEKPHGMSAWVIGPTDHVTPLTDPVTPAITEQGPARVTISWTRTFQSTALKQSISLPAHGAPVFTLDTEWKELGSRDHLIPFLKVAFDINTKDAPTFTLQTPYATIEKPLGDTDRPALKFADLADRDFGAALLNDSKHGYSAKDHTLRLSLIRSSFYPDPHPNDRPQHTEWSLVPHAGSWKDAHILQLAETFNHPLLPTLVRPNPTGTLPGESSLLGINDAPTVAITGVKRAEDDNSLIVRFYESQGQPTPATLTLPFTPKQTQTVNFIEDPLHDEPSPTVQLRPHEIRTLKLQP